MNRVIFISLFAIAIPLLGQTPPAHSKPNVPLYLGVALLAGLIVGGSISGLVLLVGRGMRTGKTSAA